MHLRNLHENPRVLMYVGLAMFILANPLLYVVVGGLLSDIKNLFGANIDQRMTSFNTSDSYIQAMNLISGLGVIIFIIGMIIDQRSRKNGL